MKNLLLLIAGIFCLSITGFSQMRDSSGTKSDSQKVTFTARLPNGKDTAETVYGTVEIMAEFPGGQAAWAEYLSENINGRVPHKHKAPAGEYSVQIRFVISKDGSITDMTPLTNYGYGM